MCPVDRRAPRRSTTRTLLLFAVVLGIGFALALAIVNRRTTLKSESALPARDARGQLGVDTPNLEGPDALELAPLVALTTTGFAFDHEPVDRAGLESRLRTYRANFSLLHPGEPAPREILLACTPAVSSERVFSVLETAHPLGFDHARLVFQTMRGQTPTSVGEQPPGITAAQVSIGGDTAAQGGERLVRSPDVQNCYQLSERVIALRRAGITVRLVMRATN